MSLEKELHARSGSKCELCGATENLTAFKVPPTSNGNADECVLLCDTCQGQITNPDTIDANHWRCLNDTMWSETPAVQVLAWRMLNAIKAEGWPQDLLDMLYLDEDTLTWAKATGADISDEDTVKHIDANGVLLQAGDSVVIMKDLNVKGGGFTAKRGTAVRNIILDRENGEFIEGRVNGQQIVLITKYVKKL